MRTVLILSGGMDSVTLLYWLLKRGHEVHGLTFDYGQKHSKEIGAARTFAARTGIPHKTVPIDTTLFLGSSQTSPEIEVPEGHYEDKSMRATVVPNRNMSMLSLAAAYAISMGIDRVAYACHSGDHVVYPDCRKVFVEAMHRALQLCDYKAVNLVTPFIERTKAEIVTIGTELDVPYKYTWSCYKGMDLHCGKCGTCTERVEAFELAGVEDPTKYE